MVKEEFIDGELNSIENTNFKTLMIINWVSFILASISGLILVIIKYKYIKINNYLHSAVAWIGFASYIISFILSIVGLAREHHKLSSTRLEQKKKYLPHFISLLILTIISVIVGIYIFLIAI
jgi:hypothetical protein